MSVRSTAASLGRPRFLYALILGVLAACALPTAASATVLPGWGSSLSATPNYDTANGDYTKGATAGFTDNNPAPGSGTAILDKNNNAYHGGDDLAVWNPGYTAPAGGQVREIRIKGCAWNDSTAPGYPNSETSAGTPVNMINFQTLSPSGGSYTSTATAPGFALPFCSNPSSPTTGQVNTSTVTSFQPIHMCINQGDVVGFEDTGGFITGGWYPNGVPFLILAGGGAAPTGSTVDSYVHAENTNPYSSSNTNFGSEPREELELQVIEGTGDDAYGLCPGGSANEPAGSNTVTCVYHSVTPGDGHPLCNAQGLPIPGTGGSGSGGSGSGGSGSGGSGGSGSGSGGSGSGSGGGTHPSAAKLKLSLLRLNPPSFFASKGTTVTYTDSRAAKTTLHVFQLVPGMRRGKACVAIPKHKHGHVAKCTRMVSVKTLVHQDKAGGDAVKLRGLKAGKYELKATAKLGSAQSSAMAHFKVKGKRH